MSGKSKRARYGLPFHGSKRAIAEKIVSLLPEGERLIDAMAGGCAVTHCAMLSGKWKKVVANDINGVPQVFEQAINGEIPEDKLTRWVSREEFHAVKDSDPLTAIIWSFGNNRNTYMYSREIEPYKRAVHELIHQGLTPTERRLMFAKCVRELLKYIDVKKRQASEKGMSTWTLEQDKREQRADRIKGMSTWTLEHYERERGTDRIKGISTEMATCSYSDINANAVQGVQGALETAKTDYRELTINDGDVVYCDPPYQGTHGYGIEFDHEAFREWCHGLASRGIPVYVSEYKAPDDRFTEVASWQKMSGASGQGNKPTTERLFKALP